MANRSKALSNRQIARAALVVITGFLASGLLGLIRTAVISATFGASDALDAFYAAQRIPETIFVLVAGGALGSSFIPVFSRYLAADDRESAAIGSLEIDADEQLDIEKQIPLSTGQIQEMVNGTFTNNGFIIIADTELDDRFSYRTSDASASAKRPKLVIHYTTSSSTPTSTPTAGPSPTATRTPTPGASPTPTATQPSQGGFNSATLVHDGDGKRVKSTINSSTTYFVGNHYEVTGSTIVKYYYAGAQRIAMRTNGTLNYLLGDHLGSTSLITDSAGTKTNEQQYKAWGETRYTFGSEKTRYTYTGQFSDSYINLLWYGSRHYDPELGRFIQPDSIVPVASLGVQAWDRYGYVNNNPVRFTDPTGHEIPCGAFCSFWSSVSNWWTGNGTGCADRL